MKVPFLDLKPQHQSIKKEIFARLDALYDQTEFAYGKTGKEFEMLFSAFNQCRYAVALDNGTTAVELALRSAGIGQGDEVITVSNTFIATVAAIHFTGATPVFCDIDAKTWNIDAAKIEEKISPRTKAIIAVYLYGQPAEMLKIKKIAEKYHLVLIADCAQSIGSQIFENGAWKPAGCFADIASFSFYAGKNMGACGEAGAIVTNNEKYAAFASAFRDHGSAEKYIHQFPGRNHRIDAFQAAILSVKLKYINTWNEMRQQVAGWYINELAGIEGLQLPYVARDVKTVWHLFVVLVENRDDFQQYLAAKGIGTAFHYKIPVHLQQAFSHLGLKQGHLPVTEYVEQRNISLPMYPELTHDQISYTCEVIREYFKTSKV